MPLVVTAVAGFGLQSHEEHLPRAAAVTVPCFCNFALKKGRPSAHSLGNKAEVFQMAGPSK